MKHITEGRGTTQTHHKNNEVYSTLNQEYHTHSSAWALWRWSPCDG